MSPDTVTSLIVIGVYLLGVILYAVIGSILFKYREGEWEMICGVPCEKDEECQRGELVARAFLWPMILCALIILLPVILIDRLSSKIHYSKNRK